jgi:hypothetical protein
MRPLHEMLHYPGRNRRRGAPGALPETRSYEGVRSRGVARSMERSFSGALAALPEGPPRSAPCKIPEGGAPMPVRISTPPVETGVDFISIPSSNSFARFFKFEFAFGLTTQTRLTENLPDR